MLCSHKEAGHVGTIPGQPKYLKIQSIWDTYSPFTLAQYHSLVQYGLVQMKKCVFTLLAWHESQLSFLVSTLINYAIIFVICNGHGTCDSLFPVFLMKFYATKRLRMQRRHRQLNRAWKRVDVVRRRLKKQQTQLLALAFSLCMSPPIEQHFWVLPSRYLSSFYYRIFGTAQIIAMNYICVTTVATSQMNAHNCIQQGYAMQTCRLCPLQNIAPLYICLAQHAPLYVEQFTKHVNVFQMS